MRNPYLRPESTVKFHHRIAATAITVNTSLDEVQNINFNLQRDWRLLSSCLPYGYKLLLPYHAPL